MVMPANSESPPKGLVCPQCQHPRMPTLYTRREGAATVRVRQCRKCGKKVKTEEEVVGEVEPQHTKETT